MGSLDIKYLLEVAMAYLPSGFRFHPTDEEVINDYLYTEGRGPTQEFIVMPEIDICRWEPKELLMKFREKSIFQSKDQDSWFFCKQEQGQTAKRSTKEGSWKVTGAPSDVKASNNQQVIGKKRFLTFYERAQGHDSKARKTDWVMHEYSRPDCSPTGNNFVVCHIMLKRDNRAVSSPLFSSEDATNDLMDIIDDFHPEDLILEKIKSLQSLLESPNQRTNHANGGVCNIWDASMRAGHEGSSSAWSGEIGSAITGESQSFRQQSFNDTGDSSLMELSILNDSADDEFLFYLSEGREQDFFQGISMDEDEHSAVHGTTILEQVLNGIFMDEDEQTAGHETAVLNQFGRQTVIKENRQIQTVKSLHGVLPVDEKEGFIEDTSRITKPPACMPPCVCPSIMSKSEGSGENSLQKLNTNPRLIKKSVKSENIYINSKESGLLTKVKMESTSSGTAPGKAKAMEANTHATAASLIQKKQLTTSSLEILKAGKKLGQETKLKSETRSVSFCSTCRGKQCSCNPPPIVYLVNLFVGIVLIVVLSEMFNL